MENDGMAAELMIAVKLVIPEDWLRRAVCPICGGANLSIKHLVSEPDQIACENCTASYEVAQDGAHVRLVVIPPGLPEEAGGRWLTPAEVKNVAPRVIVLPRMMANIPPTLGTAASVVPVNTQLVVERARKLRVLGNSPDKIRSILSGSGGITDAQVDEAIGKLYERAPGENSPLFWVGVITLIILIAAIGVVLLIGMGQRASPGAAGGGVPGPLQTLSASGSGLLKPAAVVVWQHQTTGKRPACPTQPANAARMFGGDESMWSITVSGWTMFTTRAQTISVPEGMKGEYPVFRVNPEMVQVNGPATLENVLYMNISCGKRK
jgi:hypothetical protein